MVRLLSAQESPAPSPVDWDQIPAETVLPGIGRQTFHGDHQTIVRYVYQPGSEFPVHHHPEEQFTIVLSGVIDFTVDGQPVRLGPGECALIPSNVSHGAQVNGAETVVTLNTMSPRRIAAPVLDHDLEGSDA